MNNNISVVVCVKNEEKRIGDCLNCIVKNNPDEIIVVVGKSSDRTAELALRYTNKVIQTTTNSNLTKDRQIGINNAKNPYIAMIDADHRLKKNDLKLLLKDLKSMKFDIVQAQLKSYKNNNILNKGEEEMWELNHNIPGPKKMIGVAPAMYKRVIFNKIRFDDTITKTIDDTDFIYRLSKISNIRYGIGKTKVAQIHDSKIHDYLKKFKWYGIGDGEFCIKHRNRLPSMWFHLLIRYPIIYPLRALLNRKFCAALFCWLQGVVRAKWMFYTFIRLNLQK